MFNKSANIKLLLKYYNYFPDNNYFHIISTNDQKPTTSSSSNALNKNNKNSINSILSNDKNQIKQTKNNKEIYINLINQKEMNKNFKKELEQDYLIYFNNYKNYNNLENSFPPKIINIKMCIYSYLIEKKKLNFTLDSLMLFKYYKKQYIILNDNDNFYASNNKTYNLKDSEDNNISNATTLYYYINNDKIKIKIELYSQSIDSISINVSKICSLLMLKYIILLKLREIEKNEEISNFNKINNEIINNLHSSKINLITIEDLEKKEKIYGNGIMNSDLNDYLVKTQTNRNFDNNSTISNVYNYYMNIQDKFINLEKDTNNIKYEDNSSVKCEGILNFIFMENKNNKLRLGLDFRFTILQYFEPLSKEEIKEDNEIEVINYYNNDFDQIKSGINLYFNCLNNDCIYNKKLFILNLGYGTFDIFSLIRHNSLCPFCNTKNNTYTNNKHYSGNHIKNNIELKFLGMMNSKWTYKGYLAGIKMSITEGKGLTVINDLLYKTKEFNFLKQFKKLLFQIEIYISKNYYIENQDNSLYSEKMDYQCDIINNYLYSNTNKNKIKDNNSKNDEINKNKINQKENIIKNNSNNSNKFINLKKKSNNNIQEDIDIDNNIFMSLKSKHNLYRKNNTIKQINEGNKKRFSQNYENYDNNNTNIDFNIIIDKTKTNCCENCFDYDQISQVCSIF